MKGNLHGEFFTGPSFVTHGGSGVVVILGLVGRSGYSVAGFSVLGSDFTVEVVGSGPSTKSSSSLLVSS